MTLPDRYAIRFATEADIDTLVEHRRSMWHDMGQREEALLDEMSARARPWILERMAAGDYRTWLVECGDEVVAGAAAWERERHPAVGAPNPRYVYVLNVYTAPGHRRLGLARGLMELIIAWAREQGHDTIDLTASAEGQPLYESLGFGRVSEMRLRL